MSVALHPPRDLCASGSPVSSQQCCSVPVRGPATRFQIEDHGPDSLPRNPWSGPRQFTPSPEPSTAILGHCCSHCSMIGTSGCASTLAPPSCCSLETARILRPSTTTWPLPALGDMPSLTTSNGGIASPVYRYPPPDPVRSTLFSNSMKSDLSTTDEREERVLCRQH